MVESKAKQEMGSLALKINRLELVLNELVKTVNTALYQKEKRLNDVENDILVIRDEMKKNREKPKTSDTIEVKDEKEKVVVELGEDDYLVKGMRSC